MKYITELGSNKQYGFIASTPMQAMEQMAYTLGIDKSKIQTTKTNRHIYIDHYGKTYAIAL